MNSREKGKRGERQWRDELRANGYDARRGQQFSGSPDSPDVICDQLRWIHFEVKAVEKLNVQDAMDQAKRDAGLKVPVVAHKRNFREWLVTMTAEVFFRFLRGDCGPEPERSPRYEGTHAQRRDVSPWLERFGTAAGPDNNNQQKKEANEDK
jgi:hypothetical protein